MFLNIKPGLSKKKNMQMFTDEELIQSYKVTGNADFLGELFVRYTHLVFGVCMKYLNDVENSKDAVMQIFELLHEKLHEFEIEHFKGWIHTVSRNHCLMIIRREKMERKHQSRIYEDSRDQLMESGEFSHLFEGDRKEKMISMLGMAIGQLKTEQKTCIELLYLQQKSYREVAEITGYDLKKVKSYIQNGKRNLKLILENQ